MRRFLFNAAAVVALLLLLGACNDKPAEFGTCGHAGDFYTHADSGHRTTLVCGDDLRWHKL